MINLGWLGHEMKLQIKNGLYAIYIVVNLIYLFLLGYVPNNFKDFVLSIIIFSDPTMLGMIFIGAFILLEKISGVTGGIAVSPLGAGNYVKGKVLAMLFISLATSLILVIGIKGINFNLWGLIFTIVISSMLFTMIGILIAIYTKTVNQYLMTVMGISIVTMLPLLSYFKFISLPLAEFNPSYQAFLLIEKTIAGEKIGYLSIGIILGWLAVIYGITVQQVNRKLFRG
ncbi:MAG: hypothetical protein K0S71_1205 [Clostridia bacterium]|jgi:fluoroquinolone transport system permease protein|nr:hypothetical protein [Clostridia bacterium]